MLAMKRWVSGLGNLVFALLLAVALAATGCGDDDGGAPNATPTSDVPEPVATRTPTIDEGGSEDTPTVTTLASPTPTDSAPASATPTGTPLQPCPTAVAVQCASDCSSLGGCCAVGSTFSCFDPSVQCAFPCETQPANWIGDTPCGPAPGDDPSKACIVGATAPTATWTAFATSTPVAPETQTPERTRTVTVAATETATETPTETATEAPPATPTDTSTETATAAVSTPTEIATPIETPTPSEPTETATETATETPAQTEPTATATETPTPGGSTPTPTLPFCPPAVAVQCAQQCGSLGGCCAIDAPGTSNFSCFDPSVQCDFPCPTNPMNWIGDTPCGPAPGDDPSKACLVFQTPTPTGTATATATETPTPGGQSPTPTASPTPNPCGSGSSAVSFSNNYAYPLWLAEAYQGAGSYADNIILPSSGDWQLASGATVDLCLPAGWSGRFWARTECHFATYFGNDPGYAACEAASDCTAGHLCYGGRCLLDCTSGGAGFCQGSSGLNNSNAICVTSSFAGSAKFCSYPSGVVCKTGDCQGLYQCYGQWDAYVASYGGSPPVSLFEPTSTTGTNVNYDVSLVSGYNTLITAQPSDPTCYAPTCVTDLNTSCPAALQLTQAPSATPGPIACGSGMYCQSGACVGGTCVLGCSDPSDQCALPTPPAALNCTGAVPNGNGATYFDMYASKGPTGDTMISGNQGTPTCWGDIDCLPGEVCNMTAIANFPSGVGICLPSDGSVPQPQPNCASQSDVGNACGGYYNLSFTEGIGYTCVSIGMRAGDIACVPAYDPPVSGYGVVTTNTGGGTTFYSGVAAPINPTWLAAATLAGGGTTPFYETFSNACPHQYGWTYDDHTGGFDCDTSDATLSFSINFGLAAPTPMPTP